MIRAVRAGEQTPPSSPCHADSHKHRKAALPPMDPPRFKRCLVGGTFDRLHDGHLDLLSTGLGAAVHLEVHVTSDRMASSKGPYVQPFDDRLESVHQALQDLQPMGWSLHTLDDEMGPAPQHPTADALVVSPETLAGGERINQERARQGRSPLALIEVPHRRCEDGGILSSSRIRAGDCDLHGAAWIQAAWTKNDLVMTLEAGLRLKEPAGEPFDGPEDHPEVAMGALVETLQPHTSPLIAVGDVTARTLLELGIVPDVALVDGLTKRSRLEEAERVNTDRFERRLSARSPAGRLTPDLLHCLMVAMRGDTTCLVDVDGEEDLAPLYLHLMAPLSAVIVFGMPGRGVMLQRSTLEMKERCRRILNGFEVA